MTGFPGWGEIGGGSGSGGGGGLPPSTPPSTDWAASGSDTVCPPVDQDVLDFMAECFWWEQLAEQRGRVVLIDPEYTGRSTDVYEYFNLAWEKYKHDITPDNPLIFHFVPGIHVIRNAWRRQIGPWRGSVAVFDLPDGGLVIRGEGVNTWVIRPIALEDTWDPPPDYMSTEAADVTIKNSAVYIHSLYLGWEQLGLNGPRAPGYANNPRYWSVPHDALVRKYAADGIGKHYTLFDYYDPTYASDWEENYEYFRGQSANAYIVNIDTEKPTRVFFRNCRFAQRWDLTHPWLSKSERLLSHNILVYEDCHIESVSLEIVNTTTDADVPTHTLADGVGQMRAMKWYIHRTHWCAPGIMGRTIWQPQNLKVDKPAAALPNKMWVEDCVFEYDNPPGDLGDGNILIIGNVEGEAGGPPGVFVFKNVTIRWRNDRFRRRVNAGAVFSPDTHAELTGGKQRATAASDVAAYRLVSGGIELCPTLQTAATKAPMQIYIENVTVDADMAYYDEMYSELAKDPNVTCMLPGLFVGGWLAGDAYNNEPEAGSEWDIYVRGLNVNWASKYSSFIQPVYAFNGYEGSNIVRVHWL